MRSAKEIRQAFLNYFVTNNHQQIPSASLIPQNDPTLFFTNAGMVPFKNFFTGQETAPYKRATSSQKCIRVSGKHNDLENVGFTARHHTFFEMLGNFSFGDYFKKEAIQMAWDFITKEIKLPKESLWITVFNTDDEAFNEWLHVGVDPKRIVRLGEADNFWSMGETGPCGPCSEIHVENLAQCPKNNPRCALGQCDCDRFLEIWNLVFMQFERTAAGELISLPKPSIDTGMGLERLLLVLQNKDTNYDTDIFSDIFCGLEKVLNISYLPQQENVASLRVIADHIRATVFLIADGVLPANEGRGYVLRRIMRRALRHGQILGAHKPFLFQLVSYVLKTYQEVYPELARQKATIEGVIFAEEERFLATLTVGLKLIHEHLPTFKNKIMPGEFVFKLYDTFGFPTDLTELVVADLGYKLDMQGFEKFMQLQKERARAEWKGSGQILANSLILELANKHSVEFSGYTELSSESSILLLLQDNKVVSSLQSGFGYVVTATTPFYAEGGGQVADQGEIYNDKARVRVDQVKKYGENFVVHEIEWIEGCLKTGDKVTLKVLAEARQATAKNHTATHLLHKVLRANLGEHVRQAGSLVTPEFLRFDFSHFNSLTPNELLIIENDVNQIIMQTQHVRATQTTYAEAIKNGALAFFGDKYGTNVRMIAVGVESVELCGGTHVENSGQIGLFKILTESSVAAGVRRIEAVTGNKALNMVQSQFRLLKNLGQELAAEEAEILTVTQKLKQKVKILDKELLNQKLTLLKDEKAMAPFLHLWHNIPVLFYFWEDFTTLKEAIDTLSLTFQSALIFVHSKNEKGGLLAMRTPKPLQKQFAANKVLKTLNDQWGCKGGGKPDFAQSGGIDLDKFNAVESQLKAIILQSPTG